MAQETDLNLRNKTIYQIFPRQYSSTHDFEGIIKDLDRIKDLGIDIIYLLPIHPIGQIDKKGELGCPYSIQDYEKIDSSLGSENDFKKLIEETHKRGMRLIIDCVYNHTSKDSYLFQNHKEYYNFDSDGNVICKVPDWSDVYDLNFNNKDLHRILIKYLLKWTKMGVDGFRCDVCSLVPYSFWVKAKKACKKINQNFFLLGETVDKSFGKWLSSKGYPVMSDKKALKVFDIIYDYETKWKKDEFLQGKVSVYDYLKVVYKQYSSFPDHHIITRFVDNHDVQRIASFKDERSFIRNFTAMTYFLKGTNFIYAGDEVCSKHLPSLFDFDEIDWTEYNKYEIVDLLKKLIKLKKDDIFKIGQFEIINSKKKNVALIKYSQEDKNLLGIFNFTSKKIVLDLNKEINGINVLNDEKIFISSKISVNKEPIIIKY